MLVTVVIVAGILLSSAAFALILAWLGTRGREVSVSWSEVDFRRFDVMEDLLDRRDQQFLLDQGMSRQEVAQFREARRQAMNQYLREMVTEFNAVHRAARLIAASDSTALPDDFGVQLMTVKASFDWQVTVLQLRLWLAMPGLGSVSAQPLVSPLRGMRHLSETLLSGATAR